MAKLHIAKPRMAKQQIVELWMCKQRIAKPRMFKQWILKPRMAKQRIAKLIKFFTFTDIQKHSKYNKICSLTFSNVPINLNKFSFLFLSKFCLDLHWAPKKSESLFPFCMRGSTTWNVPSRIVFQCICLWLQDAVTPSRSWCREAVPSCGRACSRCRGYRWTPWHYRWRAPLSTPARECPSLSPGLHRWATSLFI